MTLKELKEWLNLPVVTDQGALIEKGSELLFVPARSADGRGRKPELIDTYCAEWCFYQDTVLYQHPCPEQMRNYFVQCTVNPVNIISVALIRPDGTAIHYDGESGKVIVRDLKLRTEKTIRTFAPNQSVSIQSDGIHEHLYDKNLAVPYDRIYDFDGIYLDEKTQRSKRKRMIEQFTLMLRNDMYDGEKIKKLVGDCMEKWPLSFRDADGLISELQNGGLIAQNRLQQYFRLKDILCKSGVGEDEDVITVFAVCLGAHNYRKADVRKSIFLSEHFLNKLEHTSAEIGPMEFRKALGSVLLLHKALSITKGG